MSDCSKMLSKAVNISIALDEYYRLLYLLLYLPLPLPAMTDFYCSSKKRYIQQNKDPSVTLIGILTVTKEINV